MFHIAFCDDHQPQTLIMAALLDKYQKERPEIEIEKYSFSSGKDLLKSIDSGTVYDLLLLDILMPELDGIELAKIIREKNKGISIIYLTTSRDHALEAFGVSASQYIIKPIKANTFFPVLDRIIFEPGQNKERFYMTPTTDGYIKTEISSILCAELYHRKLRIHLDNGSVVQGKNVRTSFSETISDLLRDDRLILVHSSYAINLDNVKELHKDSVVMKNGLAVPISRQKYPDVKKAYLSHMSNLQNI